MKKQFFLIPTLLFLISCQSNDKEKIVTIDNKYSISLPSFLVKANTTLNEDASLQYLHTWKEFYVVVIDESKAEVQKALQDYSLTDTYSNDINGYSDLILKNFERSISTYQMSEITDTTINDNPARILTTKGSSEGIDAYYSIAFIQGKKRYYQVLVWTLSNKESEYKDKMKKIIFSLKEL